ncbi:MAG: PAC2 family protein, partial [Planctomycetota bacterium]
MSSALSRSSALRDSPKSRPRGSISTVSPGREIPTNTFYCSEEANLILFLGKEPNLGWDEYAECIFRVCEEFDVKTIYFIGSVAGLVPHTREPRLFCSVSHSALKETFQHYGVKFTNYEGPASIVTHLTAKCREHAVSMVN